MNDNDSYVATFDSKTGRGTLIPKETCWTLTRGIIPSIPAESPDDAKKTEQIGKFSLKKK